MSRTTAAPLLAALLLAACASTGPSPSTLLRSYEVAVDHRLIECPTWAVPVPCLRLREGAGGEWYGQWEIEGFTFQWGHTYRLAIEEHEVLDPPQDGSSRRYLLQEVLRDTPVAPGTQFTVTLAPGSPNLVVQDAQHLTLLLDRTVACADACEAIASEIDAGQRITLRLAHPAGGVNEMPLISWQACPASTSPLECDG